MKLFQYVGSVVLAQWYLLSIKLIPLSWPGDDNAHFSHNLFLNNEIRQELEAMARQTLPHQLIAMALIHLVSGSLHISSPYLSFCIAAVLLSPIASYHVGCL